VSASCGNLEQQQKQLFYDSVCWLTGTWEVTLGFRWGHVTRCEFNQFHNITLKKLSEVWVLAAIKIPITVSWVMTLCSLVHCYCPRHLSWSLKEGGGRQEWLVWFALRMLYPVLPSKNISPLYTRYKLCARVMVERKPSGRMLLDRPVLGLSSRCINHNVTSQAKITTTETRRQVNWRGQYQLWQPILSSIPDRLPEMDINWTFSHQSGLYAKKGA
jgi:hypothetical protein